MIDIIHGFTLLESGTKFEYIRNITNFSGHCHLLRFAFFSAKKKNPHCFVPVCRRCFYFNTFFVVGKMDSSRFNGNCCSTICNELFLYFKKINGIICFWFDCQRFFYISRLFKHSELPRFNFPNTWFLQQ